VESKVLGPVHGAHPASTEDMAESIPLADDAICEVSSHLTRGNGATDPESE
jgi:hypothetical protein